MARPISKSALIKDMASETGMSQKVMRGFLDALSNVVNKRLVAGDAVALPDLAKFETRDRPARQVRSPATGEMNALRYVRVRHFLMPAIWSATDRLSAGRVIQSLQN